MRNQTTAFGGRSNAIGDTIDTLKNAAEMTGGVAYYNTNDIAESFRKATVDSSTYYVLGYYIGGDEATRPAWHKLSVRSKRGGLKVRARKGVFTTPLAQVTNAKLDDLRVAERSPLVYTGLSLTVNWPGYVANQPSPEFKIQMDSSEIQLTADNDLSVDFFVVARAADGTLLDEANHTVMGKVQKLGEFRTRPFGASGKLNLKAPPATMRFIVRDNNSGRMGSVIVTADALPPKT